MFSNLWSDHLYCAKAIITINFETQHKKELSTFQADMYWEWVVRRSKHSFSPSACSLIGYLFKALGPTLGQGFHFSWECMEWEICEQANGIGEPQVRAEGDFYWLGGVELLRPGETEPVLGLQWPGPQVRDSDSLIEHILTAFPLYADTWIGYWEYIYKQDRSNSFSQKIKIRGKEIAISNYIDYEVMVSAVKNNKVG